MNDAKINVFLQGYKTKGCSLLMTLEEFSTLKKNKALEIIENHLEDDTSKFALSFRDNEIPTHLLATQIQNLQKSRKKLPSYYRSRCIIPSRAFEQASSELTASFKTHMGKKCLDLCCGLGIDSLAFSGKFDQVTSIEASELLAEITKYNFSKIGVKNVEVHHSRAEEYLNIYDGEPFDLIYLDPDRRDEQGRRQLLLEKCSPNVFELMPQLEKCGKRILIKVSPLFDLHEAVRQFTKLTRLWVISVGNECKEVLLELTPDIENQPIDLKIITYRRNHRQEFQFSWPLSNMDVEQTPPSTSSYLYEPDVAFYKSQAVPQLMEKYFPSTDRYLNYPDAYLFSDELIRDTFPGRRFRILQQMPYKSPAIKKWLKANDISRINISRRHFPKTVKQIRQQINLPDGGEVYLFCSMWEKKGYAWIVEKI